MLNLYDGDKLKVNDGHRDSGVLYARDASASKLDAARTTLDPRLRMGDVRCANTHASSAVQRRSIRDNLCGPDRNNDYGPYHLDGDHPCWLARQPA